MVGRLRGRGKRRERQREGAKKTSLYVVVGKIPRESVLGVLGEMH